jgi:hypothetical protein
MKTYILKAVLSVIMLCGAVVINASEDKAWLGSFTERTENWLQKSSLRSTTEEEDTTPPVEPWGAPVGDGLYPVLAMMLGYAVYLFRRNKTVKTINFSFLTTDK